MLQSPRSDKGSDKELDAVAVSGNRSRLPANVAHWQNLPAIAVERSTHASEVA